MSMCRRCDQFKATDGKWYMILGDFEYADDDDDCTVYGPYENVEQSEVELRKHSNPGGGTIDDSGVQPPPTPTKPLPI